PRRIRRQHQTSGPGTLPMCPQTTRTLSGQGTTRTSQRLAADPVPEAQTYRQRLRVSVLSVAHPSAAPTPAAVSPQPQSQHAFLPSPATVVRVLPDPSAGDLPLP